MKGNTGTLNFPAEPQDIGSTNIIADNDETPLASGIMRTHTTGSKCAFSFSEPLSGKILSNDNIKTGSLTQHQSHAFLNLVRLIAEQDAFEFHKQRKGGEL